MGKYDALRQDSPVPIDDRATLHDDIKGIYIETFEDGGVILLNKSIDTQAERNCILAEELGHYYTSAGNILDQTDIRNRKQEYRARIWAYEKLVPLVGIVQAYQADIRHRHELAEFLVVTEEFLQAALDYYKDKYGVCVTVDKHYALQLDPLAIIELF